MEKALTNNYVFKILISKFFFPIKRLTFFGIVCIHEFFSLLEKPMDKKEMDRILQNKINAL